MNAEWITIDASNKPFGRIASTVAQALQGKNRPDYTRHNPCPVHVVVINCDQLSVGIRLANSPRYHHTGYIGNLKEKKFSDDPLTKSFANAVAHMLPKNKLGKEQLTRLHCYADDQNPHHGQSTKETPPHE